jgi:hypothetical protein
VISSRAAGSTRSLSSITGGVSLAPTTGGATAGWLGGDCGSGAGRDSSAFGGLSVANTGGDAGWLLLATAVALSGKVGRGVGACGAFSAATLLAKGGDGATDAWSLLLAVVSPIGADCGAARAGLLSAAISLIGANCGAAGARLPLPATVPPADAICEPKVLSADSEAVSESASSHAQNATAQMPTVTNAPAATAVLPNLMRPVAETCRVCA